MLFNLYLNELDHTLAGIPGGFYARYSDDILFAHPDAADRQVGRGGHGDPDRRAPAQHQAREGVEPLPDRRRPTSTAWEATKPTSSVPFVGTSIFATGTVALNRKKLRRALREIERRAVRTAEATRGSDRDSLGRAVCSVVNDSIAPWPGPLQQASAPLLARAVTDRGQLAQVDYLLARMVVKVVTGDRGVRAFRRVPYRTVRQEWGLVSLEHARNCA